MYMEKFIKILNIFIWNFWIIYWKFYYIRKNQRKEGWQYRIKGNEELLKKHKLLRKIYQNENVTNDFEEFKRQTIDNFVIENFEDKELDEIMNNKSDNCVLF